MLNVEQKRIQRPGLTPLDVAEVVALTFALMWFPLFRFSVDEVDSPRNLIFGGPLPWHSPSIASSMTYDVFAIPLLIDFACWGFVAMLLLRARARHEIAKARCVRAGITTAIGVAGLFGLAFTLSVLLFFGGPALPLGILMISKSG